MASTLELVELVDEIQAVKAKVHKMWVEAAEYKVDKDMGTTYGEGSGEAYILAATNHILGAMQPLLMVQVRNRLPASAGIGRWQDIAKYVKEKLA